MPSTVFLRALGLNTSPNSLEVPNGSLLKAKNIIIKRESVIESRRGFKLFGTEMANYAKQLLQYKGRLLRHFDNVLEFQTGSQTNSGLDNFEPFATFLNEVEPGLRVKSIVSNGNLYITSAQGIQKISVKNASDLSTNTPITDAGGVKAINIEANLDITLGDSTGFLPQDSAVAYRVVWGTKDANSNLILGTPSQRVEIYNPLQGLLVRDINNLLIVLDNLNQSGSLITDGDYTNSLKLSLSSTGVDIRSNLVALASKLDDDIVITEDTIDVVSSQRDTLSSVIIVFSADISSRLQVGDVIVPITFANTELNSRTYTITNITGGGTTVEATVATGGNQTATDGAPVAENITSTVRRNKYTLISAPAVPSDPSTNQELVNVQTYLTTIINDLQNELSGIISPSLVSTYLATLEVTTTANVKLTINIPQDITSDYFVQVYRSSIAQATGTTVLADLVPGDELQQVYEAFPTSTELSNLQMQIVDITPDAFRGANLYTNATTGEGILQSNDIPPFAKDINRFKNYIFYANTRTRQRKTFNLVGVQNMVTDYNNSIIPKLFIESSDFTNIYNFTLGKKQVTDVACVNASALISTANPASYFLLNSADNVNKYYVWYKNGGLPTDPAISGRQGIEVVIDPLDLAAVVATKTRDALVNYVTDFTSSTPVSGTVRITNAESGYTSSAVDGSGGQATGFTFTIVTSGQGEKIQQKQQTITTVADVANSLNGTYFTFQSTNNFNAFYIWFKTSGGVASDPNLPNRTSIKVDINTNATAADVANAIVAELSSLYSDLFTASALSNTVTLTNTFYGPATNAADGGIPTGFTFNLVQEGALEVLLSPEVSPSKAVTETSLSLINIINRNRYESVYAFYLSGANDVPGKLFLESRELNLPQFALITNNINTGQSFSPELTGQFTITAISTGTMTTITAPGHTLSDGDNVYINNTNSFPKIDGYYSIFNTVAGTSFQIQKSVVTSGTTGYVTLSTYAETSDNEEKINRVYFSKLQQPEAVPILNYLDVGAEDKAILRIFPLRDSLFVFKQDGLYRISGEVAPFNLALFDSSTILVAPDSVSVSNNLLYGWTTKGIDSISESGVSTISRPIDVDILPKNSVDYTNFKTATWGLGYESDNSYLVWTVSQTTDTIATICYRYSTLTNTWTTYDKTNTCGIVNLHDDKLYLGSGAETYLEQERKNFNRFDYADHESTIPLDANRLVNNKLTIKLSDVSNIFEGEVVTQNQTVTVYKFNNLLEKLDLDPGTEDDYFSLLQISAGKNIRTFLNNLAIKLDNDPGILNNTFLTDIDQKSGSFTNAIGSPTVLTCANHGLISGRKIRISNSNSTPNLNGDYIVTVIDANTFSIPVSVLTAGTTGDFLTLDQDYTDVQVCYNSIITKLNADSGVSFSNYAPITETTLFEAVVVDVNRSIKQITLNIALDWLIGPMTIYKGIHTEIQYTPVHFEDPLSLKQIYEATVIFEDKTFTEATLSFSSDLLPEFIPVVFRGTGSGLFGNDKFGDNFFGGLSHSAPMRTYVPRQVQRCRAINLQYSHSVARERYRIFGITLTNTGSTSTRAYR